MVLLRKGEVDVLTHCIEITNVTQMNSIYKDGYFLFLSVHHSRPTRHP